MTNYSCSLSGQCEANPDGLYDTLAECETSCRSSEYKDLLYIIIAYSCPTDIDTLAPSDQVRIANELLSRPTTPAEARDVLQALANWDLVSLAYYPELGYIIADEAGVDRDSADYEEIVSALRTSSRDLAVDEAEVEELAESEGKVIRTLARYPALYPYLKEWYDNPRFSGLLIDTLTHWGGATTETVDFLANLTFKPGQLDWLLLRSTAEHVGNWTVFHYIDALGLVTLDLTETTDDEGPDSD